MDQIAAAFPTTFRLAIIAVVVETIFGVAAGVISGLRKGKLIDTTLLMLSLLLIATPTFVLGFLAQFVFGLQLGIAPINVGRDPSWQNLLLPGFVLGGVSFATSAPALDRGTAGADHVHRDREGLPAAAWSQARPAQLPIPVVTFIGADLGAYGRDRHRAVFNVRIGTLLPSITAGEAR